MLAASEKTVVAALTASRTVAAVAAARGERYTAGEGIRGSGSRVLIRRGGVTGPGSGIQLPGP
ncbi:hypothetical protein GCM10010440_53260 [Kitasatospora cinereorecta]